MAVRRGSSRTGTSGSTAHVQRVCAAACAPPDRARPRRSPTDAPIAPRSRSRRRRCAPSRGCSGTGASGVRPPPGSGRSARADRRPSATAPCRLLAATRIAVSGVRRSWPSDASSAVFSSSLCRVSSAALRSFEKLRALDRDGHDARRARRACRARSAVPRPPAGRWASCRPAAARAESCGRRPSHVSVAGVGARRRRRTRARSAPPRTPW